MSELRVATIQSRLHWENPEANLAQFTAKLQAISQPVDVIVLPEMFTTGFSMNTALAEEPGGPTMQWMHEQAQLKNASICGSMMLRNKHNEVYNRLIWMNPEGTYVAYNKKHLFSIGSEHQHYKPGNEKVIVTCKGFRIQLLVCYDLRFPVWIRRTPQHDYDALLFVANWPERRSEHWQALLKARAIENQSYVIGVNRVGEDGNGITHSGETSVFDPSGRTLYTQSHVEEIAIHTLSLANVTNYRNEFQAWRDADPFTLT
jgi:predicted amidohydrolase